MTDPTARTILAHIEAMGYAVSVHRMPATSLLNPAPYIEMHAVGKSGDDAPHVVRIDDDSIDGEYKAACALAVSVGIRLTE